LHKSEVCSNFKFALKPKERKKQKKEQSRNRKTRETAGAEKRPESLQNQENRKNPISCALMGRPKSEPTLAYAINPRSWAGNRIFRI
jgi:hypothetical protein